MNAVAETPVGPQVTHLQQDEENASDRCIAAIAKAMKAKDQSIRLRVPLQLWNGTQYMSWRQQVWKLDVANAAEAKGIQKAMEKFFDALYTRGPEAVTETMTALLNTRQSKQQEPDREPTPTTS